MKTPTHPLIEQYLGRLRESMDSLPGDRRDEILDEIEEHISEAMMELPSPTEADVRNLLDRLGDPSDIAAEAGERALETRIFTKVAGWQTWFAAGIRLLRRRLRLLISVLLVAVLALGGLEIWSLSHAHPLRANIGGETNLVRSQSGQHTVIQAVDPVTGHPFNAIGIPYRNGEWLEYGFTLRNDAAHNVTVELIETPSSAPFLRGKVFVSGDGAIPTDPLLVQTQPLQGTFTLRPKHARFVRIRLVFGGCPFESPPGDSATLFRQTIKFRYFGFSRSDTLPLPYSVFVTGRSGCPHP